MSSNPSPFLQHPGPAQGQAPATVEPEPVRILVAVWTHWKTIATAGTLLLGGAGAGMTLNGRVDTLATQQANTSADVGVLRKEQQAATVEHARDVKEVRQYVDTRWAETDKAQREAEKQIAVINERLSGMEKSIQRTEQNTALLLDRLGNLGQGGRRGPPAGR